MLRRNNIIRISLAIAATTSISLINNHNSIVTSADTSMQNLKVHPRWLERWNAGETRWDMGSPR